jgi:hypothetical protein
MARKYDYQGRDNDRLFSADAVHPRDQMSYMKCKKLLTIVPRPDREDDTPQAFYGAIGSGDIVMKDGLERDRRAAAEEALCFEMEAAGLMNDFPRPISDYVDSHKFDRWQPCAAASAVPYAKKEPGSQNVQERDRGKQVFGNAHPKTLDAMKNLSELYRTQRNLKDSKALDAQIKAANVNYTSDVTGNYGVHTD